MSSAVKIRTAKPSEYRAVGELLVKVYSQLEGFPNQNDQPEYYDLLLNVGQLTANGCTHIIVALDTANKIIGAVVYFEDMQYYGSGGTAPQLKNASGFRLLAVDPISRGLGIGKLLCEACINRSKNLGHKYLYIHSTESMKIARKMYERLGFHRYEPIDFKQGDLKVFGYRLHLKNKVF